jgi:hypothetical protein
MSVESQWNYLEGEGETLYMDFFGVVRGLSRNWIRLMFIAVHEDAIALLNRLILFWILPA